MSNDTSHVMHTYNNAEVFFTHGQGAWLWDETGRKYLDGLAGIAVNTLGHNHARLVAAISDQVGKIMHSSNLFKVRGQELLATKLCEMSHMDKVFFCNSGLEANEAAIKIARKYGHDKGITLPKIVVYENAFHGRSMATLSATGNAKVQKGFAPLVEGFVRVPLNDLAALEAAGDANPDIVAVFLEAIQGEGGIQAARIEYLKAARALCDRKGWLLMIDEVQCGMGRTGKWFAHQWAGIVPDVMPLAKGLASGIPIGAVVARGAAAEVFGPGNHGTTFGGNPLAMRAALETIAIIEEDGLLEHAAALGTYIHKRLVDGLGSMPGVIEIRGEGLMIGIELDRAASDLVRRALHYRAEYGMIINVTYDRVIRLLPPLIMDMAEADLLCTGLIAIVGDFLSTTPAP